MRDEDDTEGEDRPRRRHRPRQPDREPHTGDVWNIVKWVIIGLSIVLFAVSLIVSNSGDRIYLGAEAFFTLALARLAQGEQQRYPL